jgi:preprotein translocase subunit SecD
MGEVQTDPNDKDLLNQLQATVDNLIAAENLSKSNISLSTDKQAVAVANNQQAAHDAARKAAQQGAWGVFGKLHQEKDELQAPASGKAKREIISGGMPIGEQRGRQYEEWADQLEEIINNSNGPERIGQLLTLQAQLHPTQHGVAPAPTTPSTPSLQAMTWDEPPAVEQSQHTAGSGSSGKKHKKH